MILIKQINGAEIFINIDNISTIDKDVINERYYNLKMNNADIIKIEKDELDKIIKIPISKSNKVK